MHPHYPQHPTTTYSYDQPYGYQDAIKNCAAQYHIPKHVVIKRLFALSLAIPEAQLLAMLQRVPVPDLRDGSTNPTSTRLPASYVEALQPLYHANLERQQRRATGTIVPRHKNATGRALFVRQLQYLFLDQNTLPLPKSIWVQANTHWERTVSRLWALWGDPIGNPPLTLAPPTEAYRGGVNDVSTTGTTTTNPAELAQLAAALTTPSASPAAPTTVPFGRAATAEERAQALEKVDRLFTGSARNPQAPELMHSNPT